MTPDNDDVLAELVEEYGPNAMAPYALSEEEEAPPLPDSYPRAVPLSNPTHRRLAAIAGAGNAYVFLTIPQDGSQVGIDLFGVTPDELPGLLMQVAGATA